tara:strand:+ start:2102 stop:3355 length:1254 start_codon:yes stop_codon:yes gene_type:complete
MNKIFEFIINKNSAFYFIITFFYFFGILCFFSNLDPNGGAYLDYLNQKRISQEFASNFLFKFLSFDKESTRHSPLLLIILSIFEKFEIPDFVIRIFAFHFCLLLPIFFFKLLKQRFISIKKNIALLITCLIFLSPTFISLSIWPDSRIYGVTFFTLSLIYFTRFEQNREFSDVIKCIFWYAIASYFSLNFALFSIFFIFKFIGYFNIGRKLILIIFLNIILSLPALIYTFSLESIFFLKSGISGKEFSILDTLNFSNKLLIISTIFIFYLIPFYLSKIIEINFFNLQDLLISLIIFFICYFFFNYNPSFSGGGIFFKISQYLFSNNIFFSIVSILSISAIINFVRLNFYNGLIFAILILSNIQFSIYHKYYDPLLLILFLSIFDMNIDDKKINNIKLIYFYSFSIIFLILNFLKQSI